MGVFDLLRPSKETVATTKSALAAAKEQQPDDSTIGKVVAKILNVGLDGTGPISSAKEVAAAALAENPSVPSAVGSVARRHVRNAGVGGFLTGLGGFVTMPVAIPVNVLEFYVQAARMVGAIATLRGYDVAQPEIRTAVLLTLIGSKADEVLQKSGITVGSSRLVSLASKNLPPAALLMINKAVGFRLLRGVSERFLSRLGRGVPLVGGVVGGALDGFMMKRIADQAMVEFPPV